MEGLKLFKPMLACPLLKPEVEHTDNNIYEAMKKLRYPVIASLKMDGIRALRQDFLRSRTLKPIPNTSIRLRALDLPEGFDMELWNPLLSYNEIESIVMSEEHPRSNEIQFHIIDHFDKHHGYQTRQLYIPRYWKPNLFFFNSGVWYETPDDLMESFELYEKQEGEGICFRTPDSPYKQGRSTLKEQYLVKLCRYVFSECTIIGFEEQLFNGNKEKRNALDKMDRSKAKDGLRGKNTLGSFRVRNEHGIEFSVGSGQGLTDIERKLIWNEQDKWLGKVIKIRSKAHGVKIKPRSPTYWGKAE